ncbi:type VI secretion lipoprotein TssJ [Geomonas sp.]|uniref:type VI secretion lipoprotein TssJ n=1 Tax=Geomonas sp. TaxID=2651584 RepID=UPI002B474F6B|nr:type VI secretion lipoprotein TssJ [Geomonas sp.]HJV34356.1 type VI secretion lipoprotein TssJ [Geomonas sp.]
MRDLAAGLLLTLIAYGVLTGCSSDPSPAVTPQVVSSPLPNLLPPDWRYEKDAIQLHVEADPLLNLFHKEPHTLLLCTYHLRDPNAFNQLQEEKGGLQKLLDCGRFDPSVLYARRFVLQPGQTLEQALDRSDGARFIAFAAGYYKVQRAGMTASLPVPLAIVKREGAVLQIPQKMRIDLRLGPQELKEVQATPVSQKD